MPYIQITTRCNMHCAHCMGRCTAEGEDMSLETYQNALNALERSSYLQKEVDLLNLGGGEPTIHPQFDLFLILALYRSDVWLATNGTQTEKMRGLLNLAQSTGGRFKIDVSLDRFHDLSMVDPEIEKQVRELDRKHVDGVHVRNVENFIIPAGRALDNGLWHEEAKNTCICDVVIVKPNGDVKWCGCEDSPVIGNVNTGVLFEGVCTCWHEAYEQKEEFLKWKKQFKSRPMKRRAK